MSPRHRILTFIERSELLFWISVQRSLEGARRRFAASGMGIDWASLHAWAADAIRARRDELEWLGARVPDAQHAADEAGSQRSRIFDRPETPMGHVT